MNKSFSDSYKAAGVDVTAGYKAVELMKAHVARTMIPGIVSDIGGFGGLFEMEMCIRDRCQPDQRSDVRNQNLWTPGG